MTNNLKCVTSYHLYIALPLSETDIPSWTPPLERDVLFERSPTDELLKLKLQIGLQQKPEQHEPEQNNNNGIMKITENH